MEKVLLLGQMVGNMWENTKMTRNTAMVNSIGQMVEVIEENGTTVNNMERAPMLMNQVLKDTVNGNMDRELNGLE